MSLTGLSFRASAAYQHAGTNSPGGTLRARTLAQNGPSASLAYTYGTGAGKVNAVGFVERTLAASGTDTVDLSTGGFGSGAGLADVFGTTVTLTKVKYVRVDIVGGTGSGLVVGNAAGNAHQLWHGGDSHTTSITNGGVPFVQGDAAGKTVDSSNKNVKIVNGDGANTITYRLTVAGEA